MKSDSGQFLPIIIENCSAILAFAYSRNRLLDLQKGVEGDWSRLDVLMRKVPELKADRALLELAYLLRSWDDMEKISDEIKSSVGTLFKDSGEQFDLFFRDMTNKIIHASRYDWMLDNGESPEVCCVGEDAEKWTYAMINIESLASACARLPM